MTEDEVIEFNKKNVFCGLSEKKYGQTHFANRDFKKGEEIVKGYGRMINHQTSHCSVQVDVERHFVPKKWTARYWNHSCNPNTFVKTRKDGFPSLFALRNIKKGEEITFAYYMTEYSWGKNADENHAKCLCGEKKSLERIQAVLKSGRPIRN